MGQDEDAIIDVDVDTCDFRGNCDFQGTRAEVAKHKETCIILTMKKQTEEMKKKTEETEQKLEEAKKQNEEAQRKLNALEQRLDNLERAAPSQEQTPVPVQEQRPPEPKPAPPPEQPRPVVVVPDTGSSSSSALPPSFPSQAEEELVKLKETVRRMKEYGSGNSWTVKAPISSKRCFLSLVSHQNVLYCFGGTTGTVIHEYLETYDLRTKVWKNLVKMPTPRCGTTAVSLMDYVVCLGGVELKDGKQVLSTKLELYHPATGKWYTGSDMPTARAYFGAAVHDNKIFCFGGLGNDFMTMYNPVGNVWTDLGKLPTPRYAFSAIEYEGLIYLVGGSSTAENIKTVDRYDPVSRTFVNDGIVITIPGNWSSRGSAILDGKIYCIGGVSVDGSYTKTVDVYDMKKRTWSLGADQPEPRSGFGVACLDGAIFCVGGRSGDANGSYDVDAVTVYFPPTD